MNYITFLKAQGKVDLQNVVRDPFLRYITLVPLLIGFLLRLFLPHAEVITRSYGLELSDYYSLIVGLLFVVMTPGMFGMVLGFLLLDERDYDTLRAMAVTPLSMGTYVYARVILPMVISVIMTFVSATVADLMVLPLLPLLLASICGALSIPLWALVFLAIARDKVQGMVVMKGLNVFSIIPIIAYFIEEPFQWIFGVVPLYWPYKILWMGLEGRDLFIPTIIGILLHIFFILVLVKRFKQSFGS